MTTLTREELLVILIEECSEVTKAATKCLRFGYDSTGPGDYGVNDRVLADEVGDVLAVIDALPLDRRRIAATRRTKITRAEEAKARYGVGT